MLAFKSALDLTCKLNVLKEGEQFNSSTGLILAV